MRDRRSVVILIQPAHWFFFLVVVKIWHHCKGEPQEKCDETNSCEKVTSVSVQKKLDLALYSSGFHGWCDKRGTPLGAHAGGHVKFLRRLELGKSGVLVSPFPTSSRESVLAHKAYLAEPFESK